MALKKPVAVLVARAMEEIETLPVAEVQTLLAAGEITLIDIRDIRELEREGRIAGAEHAPRGMLEFWADPDCKYYRDIFGGEKKKVLFCAGALRSALAAKTLQDMGVEPVAHMEGGFGGWKEAGCPIEKPDA